MYLKSRQGRQGVTQPERCDVSGLSDLLCNMTVPKSCTEDVDTSIIGKNSCLSIIELVVSDTLLSITHFQGPLSSGYTVES